MEQDMWYQKATMKYPKPY